MTAPDPALTPLTRTHDAAVFDLGGVMIRAANVHAAVRTCLDHFSVQRVKDCGGPLVRFEVTTRRTRVFEPG